MILFSGQNNNSTKNVIKSTEKHTERFSAAHRLMILIVLRLKLTRLLLLIIIDRHSELIKMKSNGNRIKTKTQEAKVPNVSSDPFFGGRYLIVWAMHFLSFVFHQESRIFN